MGRYLRALIIAKIEMVGCGILISGRFYYIMTGYATVFPRT